MSSFETTEMKLRSTPTGGVSGEHSPYYRRLMSAGYKGFIQGTIGGAGFYGFLGLCVGAAVAIPAAFFVGPAALLAIPTAGGLGVVKGASTFGNIGTVAAISAESADLAEQRRYLLDRYYDLPDGPEGDKQAEIIKDELSRLQTTDRHHPLFHWKTVAVCAAIGGVLALATVAMGPGLALALGESAMGHAIEIFMHAGHFGAPIIGAAFGALAGSMIGLDRHYVRSWFNGAETLLHDEAHTREALRAREQQVERLRNAAKADKETQLLLERRRELSPRDETLQEAHPGIVENLSREPLPAPEAPSPIVKSPKLEARLADVQQAMQIPTV